VVDEILDLAGRVLPSREAAHLRASFDPSCARRPA